MTVDYIIVGQGLAGTVMARQLMRNGDSVFVFDRYGKDISSRVAGGIFNPITGRKMVRTWLADELFGYLFPFYEELEKELAASFFHPKPIYRPFVSVEEYNEWTGKCSEPKFAAYVRELVKPGTPKIGMDNVYGGLLLDRCGYVDIGEMLDVFRKYLEAEVRFSPETFEEDKLEITEDGVTYGDVSARKIIYCDGYASKNSRYFGYLPFRPVKGELLEIKLAGEIAVEEIYNRGVFMLPVGDGTYRVGATYDWKNLDTAPTEEKRTELAGKLEKLINCPFEIIGQRAGVRPATHDRRPFVGLHPEYPQLAVFNGLGTKGVSLAPYFAEEFAGFLSGKNDITPEVDIKRLK
ncbi:FAD-dependent oxidoreductase [Fulvitalea axinellae]|uniref:FAD-dependent oxidoreductase n=1 Tax=Fulvitalea axinellae TaxID=1182444 RepID=A0AAU9D7Z6_9BACT|nr:FAD-dependent oxidoreductase [Fulvitalea axinellae]